MSRQSSWMSGLRAVEHAGMISTRAPSCTASVATAGCHASPQISTAAGPHGVSKARSASPGVKCLRSSQMS